ncbi:zinc finger protein 541 isoform X4 [Vanacampus margaritifer]
MATLEMLLLTGALPTEDYHYAGSDVWTESESNIFNKALKSHGKNFSLIHKMVKTKTMNECVEFYYMINKSQDKQDKQTKLKNQQHKSEIEMSPSPPVEKQSRPQEAGPAPPLVGSFPCTKMFNKVKSRNAHMKIHRNFPKAWRNRLLPSNFYYQSGHSVTPGHFALNDASLPVASTYNGGPNIDVSAIVDGSIQREPPYASVFNQSWHSFEELETEAYVP